MSANASDKRFLSSRSGRGFLVYLALCAALCAAVGTGFYYSNLNWFKEHKSEEKIIALQLVDAFVTNYSAVRSKLGTGAPVPATFRAHSIETFTKERGTDTDFRLRWVGREGRQIATPPSDTDMAKVIESFVGQLDPLPHSEFITVNGQQVFRTIYPSLAREQSCVNCHNSLQPNATRWSLNDVMGGFAIDVPVATFLHSIMLESAGLSAALFLALAAIGFAFSNLHYRQIAERETAAAELGRTRTFLHTIIENMPAVVVVKNAIDRRYALFNRTAELLFGISRNDAVGKRNEEIFPDQDMARLLASDDEVLRSRNLTVIDEHVVNTPTAGTRILTTKKLVIPGDDGEPQYLLSLSEDITERKRAQEQVAHMAHHDALTDLPNRTAFAGHLTRTLEWAEAADESFAVLCIDLDRFKEINDIFGHAIGDAFLREVSRRFQSVAEGAFLARLGGDEFTFVTPNGPQPELAESLADRLHAAVAGDIEVEGHKLRTGLSIGVAIFPADGTDTTVLLNNADASLYRAKADGRGKTRFFEVEMDKRLRERRALQHELRSALSRGELSLHYQPQARIGGEVVGLEALIRWHNPARGNVPPSTFIPIAEESGLIIAIGEWVLREACREAASWPRPLTIAVNLSPIQFRHGDLAGLIHSILLETGLPAQRLELEITEGVLVEDFNRALAILRRLKALGVRVAMDDFGTGYSSLSYLKAFPFDKIKIDRSFITNVDRNPQSTAIVCAVIGLARGLHLPVLAEGVETEGELEFLSREACDEVQGYLVGKPLPIADYAEVVGRSAEGRPAARATA